MGAWSQGKKGSQEKEQNKSEKGTEERRKNRK